MISALIYALCLLYAPPTPPVYQGLAIREEKGLVWFARCNRIPDDGEAFILDAFALIGISDKDKKIFLGNPGKLLQLVARETKCHGTPILRVSYWRFVPTKELKK